MKETDMKRSKWILIVLVALACCWGVPTVSWAQTEDEIKKMEEAMPSGPRVAPKQPHKLLVFNLCKGYAHGSVPYGAKAFEIMGKKTGAFEAVSSDDPAVFAADRLKQFDAVCFNNSTGDLFDDPALRQSLLDFIKSGKGVVGVHAATDCFYDWAEFGEMLGAYFDGHPWGSGETVRVKVDDPGHALCAAFKARGFFVKDEMYQFKAPYDRAKLRVLLSIDVSQTDMTKEGIKRTDGDFAVSWAHMFDKGRVFYCSLGHNNEIFWNPVLLQHYLDGIQFALGDLAADTTPSAQLSPADEEKSRLAALRGALDGVLERIVTYNFGDSRAAFSELNDLVIESYSVPKFREDLADKLAALLGSDATRDCKQYVCRQLYVIGTAKQVPAIAALLTKAETSDMARYALERMPDPAADKALMDALGKVSGGMKVGMINSLGERRTAKAVPALAKLISAQDAVAAKAAVAALGKIANAEAVKALADAKGKATADSLPAVADAYLMCADRLLAEGDKEKALAIYEEMFKVTEPKPIHVAAFQGLVTAKGGEAASLVLDALASDDPVMHSAGAGAARTVPGTAATASFASGLAKLSPPAQALLTGALADRGDKAAQAAVTEAVKSREPAVRAAALSALGALGDAGSVGLLVNVAATAERQEADAARASLDRLRGENVDAAMVEALKGADVAGRKELIRSLAARSAVAAVPVLLEQAKDADEGVRVEALKGLGVLGTEKDLPGLISLLVAAKGDSERGEGEKAVVALARKMKEGENRAALILDALDNSKDVVVKASLVGALGELGDRNGLEAVRSAAKSKKKELEDAGIRALVDWPDVEPMDDVRKLAKESDDETYRVLAVRGFIRMIELSKRKPAETLDLYLEAMQLATRTDEKRKIIAGMAGVPDDRVPGLLESYKASEDLKEEAQKALERYQNETSKKK